MRGRKPLPKALRELSGNAGHRPIHDEPTPPSGEPTCPRELSKDAKKEWKRIVPDLMQMGVLTRIDTAALAAYCECWSRWRDAERNITKYGAVIKTPTGYPIQSPYLGISNKALEQMRKFMVEFGLTPSSRSRITGGAAALPPPGKQDEYDFLVQ